MDATSEEVRGSTKMLRKTSVSSSRSGSATERCRQELDDYDVTFDIRPPSGTNHQVNHVRILGMCLVWQH